MKKIRSRYLLAPLSTLITLSAPVPWAIAAENTTITVMEQADEDLFLELSTRQEALQTQKEALENQQQQWSSKKIYWGKYDDGEGNTWQNRDATWHTLWGFVLPGIPQLVTVFDSSAPAWLRWTEGAQLLSLGVLSFGGYQLFGEHLPAPYTAGSQWVNDSTAQGLFYGGLGAYTALALVPSGIVSIHDHFSGSAFENNMRQNQEQLTRIDQELESLRLPLHIFNLAVQQNYSQALVEINALSSEQIEAYDLHFERLKQWKQKVFDKAYQGYLAENLGTEAKLEQLIALTEHPYLSTRPELQTRLQQERTALQAQRDAEQATLQAREQALAEESERQTIFSAAYALAAKGDFFEAIEKLDTYVWKPEHSQYAQVQEKRKTWDYAWYTKMYKYAYNKAGAGDVEGALDALLNLQLYWPKDHPDYQRVAQKIKDWQHIYGKQKTFERKHGFLNKEQMRLLKSKGYPVIMTSTFPSNNDWRFVASTQSAYNQYSIFYYDTTTRKSFSIIGGRLCGDLGLGYYRQVKGKAQQFVNNPVLGPVGLISLGYADAYLTTDLRKNTDICYTVVTPGNLEDWMVTDEDAPASLQRLTKAEFIQVIQSLKYLP